MLSYSRLASSVSLFTQPSMGWGWIFISYSPISSHCLSSFASRMRTHCLISSHSAFRNPQRNHYSINHYSIAYVRASELILLSPLSHLHTSTNLPTQRRQQPFCLFIYSFRTVTQLNCQLLLSHEREHTDGITALQPLHPRTPGKKEAHFG